MKRILMTIGIALFSAAFFCGSARAQAFISCSIDEVLKATEAVNEQLKVSSTYGFHFMIRTSLFEGDSTPSVFKGSLVKKGAMLRMENGSTVLVQDRDYRVVIDTSERSILVSNPQETMPEVNLFNLEVVKNTYVESCEKLVAGKLTHYLIRYKSDNEGRIRTCELDIDSRNFVTHLKIIFTSGGSMEIEYNDHFRDEPLKEKLFDTRAYIRPKGNVIEAVAAYKNYELINIYLKP